MLQRSTSCRLKIKNVKNSKHYKMGFIFHDFSPLYDFSHIFSIFGEIKVSQSQNLNFGNFKCTIKWGLFFMIFPAQYDNTHFFHFAARSVKP